MDAIRKIKNYLNNGQQKNINKKLKTNKKRFHYNKNRKKEEYKKLLKKSTHIKNEYINTNNYYSINNCFENKDENFSELSYIYKPYFILFLFFTFLFLSLFYQIKSNNNHNPVTKAQKIDITKYYKSNKIIKVGYFSESIKYGGVERVMALLINYLSKEKYFKHYLITKKGKLEDEYSIPNETKRISLLEDNITLFEAIEKEDLDILVYNFYETGEIEKLNKLNKTKVIYYNHSSFLLWIYQQIYNFKYTVYKAYKECKYVLSLIPLENDYLFKLWGINSILIDNPTSFEYDTVIPSDLSNQNIIMVGRASDPIKRYDLGIKAMRNIIKELPECKMNIVSSPNLRLERLIKIFDLENNVKFVGFTKNIEIHLKDASLHIFPSVSETYPMVLGEAKIFGIPTIICGLDYLSLAKGGTVIIYDDNPETIAKEAIKILKNETYRKILGKEARESMVKHKNKLIAKKWVKILMSVYNGDDEMFHNLNGNNNISDYEAETILSNQLKMLKRRKPRFRRITLEKLKFFTLK